MNKLFTAFDKKIQDKSNLPSTLLNKCQEHIQCIMQLKHMLWQTKAQNQMSFLFNKFTFKNVPSLSDLYNLLPDGSKWRNIMAAFDVHDKQIWNNFPLRIRYKKQQPETKYLHLGAALFDGNELITQQHLNQIKTEIFAKVHRVVKSVPRLEVPVETEPAIKPRKKKGRPKKSVNNKTQRNVSNDKKICNKRNNKVNDNSNSTEKSNSNSNSNNKTNDVVADNSNNNSNNKSNSNGNKHENVESKEDVTFNTNIDIPIVQSDAKYQKGVQFNLGRLNERVADVKTSTNANGTSVLTQIHVVLKNRAMYQFPAQKKSNKNSNQLSDTVSSKTSDRNKGVDWIYVVNRKTGVVADFKRVKFFDGMRYIWAHDAKKTTDYCLDYFANGCRHDCATLQFPSKKFLKRCLNNIAFINGMAVHKVASHKWFHTPINMVACNLYKFNKGLASHTDWNWLFDKPIITMKFEADCMLAFDAGETKTGSTGMNAKYEILVKIGWFLCLSS